MKPDRSTLGVGGCYLRWSATKISVWIYSKNWFTVALRCLQLISAPLGVNNRTVAENNEIVALAYLLSECSRDCVCRAHVCRVMPWDRIVNVVKTILLKFFYQTVVFGVVIPSM